MTKGKSEFSPRKNREPVNAGKASGCPKPVPQLPSAGAANDPGHGGHGLAHQHRTSSISVPDSEKAIIESLRADLYALGDVALDCLRRELPRNARLAYRFLDRLGLISDTRKEKDGTSMRAKTTGKNAGQQGES
jgi:hypothetical protein